MTDQASSHRYQKVKHQLFFTSLFLDLAVFLLIFQTGLSAHMHNLAEQVSGSVILIHALYILILGLIMYAIHFPISVFLGYIWEHRFNLSNQSFGQWWADDLKKNAIGFIFILLIVEVIYLFLAKYPDTWWVLAASFWIFLTFILAKLTPNYIIPLFFKYSDIDDQQIKDKVFEVFRSCNVALKDIYEIDFSKKTKKANAFVCGLGASRRVVLSDTLVDKFTSSEIQVVVAHELGHYKHKDIIKLLMVNALVIFGGLFLIHWLYNSVFKINLADIVYLPLLAVALIVFGLMTTPLTNWFSRLIETEADRFSIETTKKPHDFISTMQKLGEMNLAEMQPSRFIEWMFYDHPPIGKRIKFAQQFI